MSSPLRKPLNRLTLRVCVNLEFCMERFNILPRRALNRSAHPSPGPRQRSPEHPAEGAAAIWGG